MSAGRVSVTLIVHDWNKMDLRKPEAEEVLLGIQDQLESAVTKIGQVGIVRKMLHENTLRMIVDTVDKQGLIRNLEMIENVEMVDEPLVTPGAIAKIEAMTDEEVKAVLEDSQKQLNAVRAVAKAKGIKISEPKDKKGPQERLQMHLDKLGYAVGTRKHAENRVTTSEDGVAEAMEEFKWESPLDATEVAQIMVNGYRRAHQHHSFPSNVLSGKGKEPSDVAVMNELLGLMVTHTDAHDLRVHDLFDGAKLSSEPRG